MFPIYVVSITVYLGIVNRICEILLIGGEVMDIAKKIKTLRKFNNYTQKYVAECIGVTERMYRRYEHSINPPPIEVLIKLADLYEVTLDYIVGRDKR